MSETPRESAAGKGTGGTAGGGDGLRPLTPDDLARVVAIDRVLSGRSRRGFYETRLAAALREPDAFVYLGVTRGGELAGFVFARLLEGEFGIREPVAVLDAIGVDAAHRGSGLGRTLMSGLEDILRRKGVARLRSQLDWNNHALMRFLDAAGFRLAPRIVLRRPTAGAAF